jgi:hypothetical protein
MAAQQSTLFSHSHHSAALGCVLLLVKEVNVPPGTWCQGKPRKHEQACIDSALDRKMFRAKRPAATTEASATAAHPLHLACSTKARKGRCLLTYAGRVLLNRVLQLLLAHPSAENSHNESLRTSH